MSALVIATLLSSAPANGAVALPVVAPIAAEARLQAEPPVVLSSQLVSAAASVSQADAPADGTATAEPDYSGRIFLDQAKSIPWRFGLAAAAITVTGVANWDWGSSSFHFESEGFFGKDTASLGMDKLGHAWSTYVLTEFFTDGIEGKKGQSRHAPTTAALLAMGLMTYIEIFDGFSKNHGFSAEDLVADAAGALFSVARRRIPGFREKFDFRLLYKPSDEVIRSLGCFPEPFCEGDEGTARSPITDYSHQRYLVALKLSGFEALKSTPLRFVELHGGYYARGFTAEEEERGDPLKRRLFGGVGLNLSQLFFPSRPRSPVARGIKSGLEWLQIPYTAVHSN